MIKLEEMSPKVKLLDLRDLDDDDDPSTFRYSHKLSLSNTSTTSNSSSSVSMLTKSRYSELYSYPYSYAYRASTYPTYPYNSAGNDDHFHQQMQLNLELELRDLSTQEGRRPKYSRLRKTKTIHNLTFNGLSLRKTFARKKSRSLNFDSATGPSTGTGAEDDFDLQRDAKTTYSENKTTDSRKHRHTAKTMTMLLNSCNNNRSIDNSNSEIRKGDIGKGEVRQGIMGLSGLYKSMKTLKRCCRNRSIVINKSKLALMPMRPAALIPFPQYKTKRNSFSVADDDDSSSSDSEIESSCGSEISCYQIMDLDDLDDKTLQAKYFGFQQQLSPVILNMINSFLKTKGKREGPFNGTPSQDELVERLSSKYKDLFENSEFGFDCFKMSDDFKIGYIVNVLQPLGADPEVVRLLASAVKNRYRPADVVPFHNFNHGFSVFQVTAHIVYSYPHIFVKHLSLSANEIIAVLVAALVHDLDHPGTDNLHERKEFSETYQRYDGHMSVLENHHMASYANLLMNHTEANVFEGLQLNSQRSLLTMMYELILSTDMSLHSQQVQFLKEVSEVNDLSAFFIDKGNKTKMLGSILHIADLSAQCLGISIATGFESCFYAERCKLLSNQIGGNDDLQKFKATRFSSQYGFVTGMIDPLWQQAVNIFPKMQPYLTSLRTEAAAFYKACSAFTERKEEGF